MIPHTERIDRGAPGKSGCGREQGLDGGVNCPSSLAIASKPPRAGARLLSYGGAGLRTSDSPSHSPSC